MLSPIEVAFDMSPRSTSSCDRQFRSRAWRSTNWAVTSWPDTRSSPTVPSRLTSPSALSNRSAGTRSTSVPEWCFPVAVSEEDT